MFGGNLLAVETRALNRGKIVEEKIRERKRDEKLTKDDENGKVLGEREMKK